MSGGHRIYVDIALLSLFIYCIQNSARFQYEYAQKVLNTPKSTKCPWIVSMMLYYKKLMSNKRPKDHPKRPKVHCHFWKNDEKGPMSKNWTKKIKRETQTSLPLMCIDYESFQFKDEQNRPRNKKVMTIFRKKKIQLRLSRKVEIWKMGHSIFLNSTGDIMITIPLVLPRGQNGKKFSRYSNKHNAYQIWTS